MCMTMEPTLIPLSLRQLPRARKGYPAAWARFRRVSGEESALLGVLKEFIHTLSGEARSWSLVDVGSGDGRLLAQLMGSGFWALLPNRSIILDPSPVLLERARRNLLSEFPGRIFAFQLGALKKLATAQLAQSHWGALAVHSTYYFDEDDIRTLGQLKKKGVRIVMLENHPDCWVARILAAVNGKRFINAQTERYELVLDQLGLSRKEVVERRFPCKLTKLSKDDV